MEELPLDARGIYFRAIKSAVSLKRLLRFQGLEAPCHFRAIKSAVSLKLATVSDMVSHVDRFPRHQKRGLIEATEGRGLTRLPPSFPRHQKRGLIEAGRFSVRRIPPNDFRAIKSAVSLKLPSWIAYRGHRQRFPRHQKRGLIEAPFDKIENGFIQSFPRHQKRGLIEAISCFAFCLVMLVFPRHQKRGLIEANR